MGRSRVNGFWAITALVLLAPGRAMAGTRAHMAVDLDGRAYVVDIDVPDGPPPPRGFPVVYVVDGNAFFEMMVGAVRKQAFAPDWTGVSDAVVVGVDRAGGRMFGPDRRQDLTPAEHDLDGHRVGGGAEAFRAVLLGPVADALSARARIDPDRRVLFGHSLGGLFALHETFAHPTDFTCTIASSPSIWWAPDRLSREQDGFVAEARRHPGRNRLLILVGQWEARPGPDAQVAPGLADRRATLRSSAMVTRARQMAQSLARDAGAAIGLRFDYLRGEDHMSAPPIAMSRGVRFCLGRF